MAYASRISVALGVGLSVSVLFGGGIANAKDPAAKKKPLARASAPAPSAPSVVVRRTATLESAMRTALSKSGDLGPKATVTVIVDPTPAVRHAEKAIGDALAAYGGTSGRPTSWQAATLGGAPSTSFADPAALRSALGMAISKRGKPVRDTVGSLRKTIKKTPGPGLVVYLAHGHFEDDCDLEGLIADLLAQKKVLCVIGPEAAFEWAWGDVVADIGDWKFEKGDFSSKIVGVGNLPFGPEDATAPWHGGDTATPMAPICLAQGAMWKRETSPRAVGIGAAVGAASDFLGGPPDPAKDLEGFDRWARAWVVPPDPTTSPDAYKAWVSSLTPVPDPTDKAAYGEWFLKLTLSAPPSPLLGRSPPKPEPTAGVMEDDRLVLDDFAVPSSFGPYGLMRACGATGGVYILWSWSRSHDVDSIKYEYARCDGTAPDLRARSEIAADIAKQPLFEALLAAWTSFEASGGARNALVSCSAPWRAGASAPIEGTLGELYLVGIIDDAKDRDAQIGAAAGALTSLASARHALETALAAAKDPGEGPARRLRADAELTVHVIQSAEYQITEYRSHLQTIDASWWKAHKGKKAYVKDVDWVKAADSGDPVTTTAAKPREATAAQQVLESRKAFVSKWKGTPFGAMVSRNALLTFEVDVWVEPRIDGHAPPAPGKGSSSGSGGPATGGSTGGGGPTTGK